MSGLWLWLSGLVSKVMRDGGVLLLGCLPLILYELHFWHDGGLYFLIYSLCALAMLSLKMASRNILISPLDGPLKILAMMRKNEKNREAQLQGLGSLHYLLKERNNKDDINTKNICELNSIAVLCHTLKCFPLDGKVINGCFTIWGTLSAEQKVKEEVAKNPDLLTTLIKTMNDLLSALKKKASTDKKDEGSNGEKGNRGKKCSPAGSLAATKGGVGGFGGEKVVGEILRKGCLLLGAMVDSGSESVMTMAVDLGGMEIVLDTMEHFPKHEQLQQWGCYALLNLTYDHSLNKVTLVKRNGFRRVLAAMDAHPNSPEVQRFAMAILYNTLRQVQHSDSNKSYKQTMPGADVGSLRRIAVGHGMINSVSRAVSAFAGIEDITRMGKELMRVAPNINSHDKHSSNECSTNPGASTIYRDASNSNSASSSNSLSICNETNSNIEMDDEERVIQEKVRKAQMISIAAVTASTSCMPGCD